MALGDFFRRFKKHDPPMTDTAYAASMLYGSIDFTRYNPDDLIGRQGWNIYRKMLNDEQVKVVVRFRRNAISGRRWFFEFPDPVDLPDEEKDRRIRVMTEAVKQMRGSFQRVLNGILSSMTYGFSLSEKTFKPITVEDRAYWGIKAIRTKPFETFSFETDEYGVLQAIKQNIGGKEIEIDPDRFIHHVYNPDVDEYYGKSELREIYRAWWSKDVLIKLQNLYLERIAGGFVWAQPKDGTIQPGSTAETNLKKVVRSVKTATSILMPAGVDLNIENPTSTDAFERAIIGYNLAIAKGLLMPNLLGYSEQGPNGSRALGDTQLEAFLWMLDAEAADLEETLNEQLFRQLGDFNFADGVYPLFRFRPLSQSMVRIIAETWGNLVSKGAVKATETDEGYIRELLGFPERGDDLNPAQIPELPAPHTAPEDKQDMPPQVDVEDGAQIPGQTIIGRPAQVEYAAFSRATKRVDFTGIDRSTSALQFEGVSKLEDVFIQMTDEVKREIMTDMDLMSDPQKAAKYKLPAKHAGQLRRTVESILKKSWEIGERNAKSELKKAGLRKSMSVEKYAAIGPIATEFFKARSFSIAGSLLDDYAAIIKNEILQGIKFSKPTQEVIDSIYRSLAKAGMIDPAYVEDLLGEALNVKSPRARLETITRTTTFEAINEARFSFFTDSDLQGFVTALEYSAILDGRTTPICRELGGADSPNGEPYIAPARAGEWDSLRPPNHFNCRSLLIPVTVRDEDIELNTWRVQNKPQEGFG